jgi:hypothetical protein
MNLSPSSYRPLEYTLPWSELPRNICFPYPSATIYLKGCLSTEQLLKDIIGFPTWIFYINPPQTVSQYSDWLQAGQLGGGGQEFESW